MSHRKPLSEYEFWEWSDDLYCSNCPVCGSNSCFSTNSSELRLCSSCYHYTKWKCTICFKFTWENIDCLNCDKRFCVDHSKKDDNNDWFCEKCYEDFYKDLSDSD